MDSSAGSLNSSWVKVATDSEETPVNEDEEMTNLSGSGSSVTTLTESSGSNQNSGNNADTAKLLAVDVLLAGSTSGQTGTKTVEQMLYEAQRESSSSGSSRFASSRTSPKGLSSPVSEAQVKNGNKQLASDIMWDWASRPEVQPPSDFNGFTYSHHGSQSPVLMAGTKALDEKAERARHLISHTMMFIGGAMFGAACIYFLTKKCWPSSAPAASSTDAMTQTAEQMLLMPPLPDVPLSTSID